MTTIEFECSACVKQIKAPEQFAGQKTKCPHCQAELQIPMEMHDHGYAAAQPPGSQPDFAPDAPLHRSAHPPAPAASAPEGNPAIALGAAAGGAALGAVIWAAIVLITNYEVGWVAWGVGGLVGGACAGLGGRGHSIAGACAGLALASILIGKLAATHFMVEGFLDTMQTEMESYATQESYDAYRAAWTDFAEFSAGATNDQIEEFMLDYEYEGTVAEFRAEAAPELAEMARRDPSFSEWRAEIVDGTIAEARAEISLMDIVSSELSAIDLLFAFLGVSTAFGLVMGATRKDEEAAHAMARNE